EPQEGGAGRLGSRRLRRGADRVVVAAVVSGCGAGPERLAGVCRERRDLPRRRRDGDRAGGRHGIAVVGSRAHRPLGLHLARRHAGRDPRGRPADLAAGRRRSAGRRLDRHRRRRCPRGHLTAGPAERALRRPGNGAGRGHHAAGTTRGQRVTFERLTIGDAIAWIAALALLLFTAVDWYSTVQGNEARQIQHDVTPQGALGGDVARDIQQQANETANGDEKNLWQEHRAIDRLILVVLLGAAFAAAAAAALRVADRRFKGWLTPSAVAALLAAAGALLVLYRLGNQPGDDAATTLKSGPWLAL